jgi:hypothetical protein
VNASVIAGGGAGGGGGVPPVEDDDEDDDEEPAAGGVVPLEELPEAGPPLDAGVALPLPGWLGSVEAVGSVGPPGC